MAIEKKYVETPLMKQYYQIKAVHPDAILLFRVGDFYETFGDDAIKASSILGITLTKRANGAASSVELAGFPHHAVDAYLPKLVRAGERVAICEQLEDPKLVKGLVKRGVIELVTPGVVLGDNILPNKENSFLASIYFGKNHTGVAFLDISTGEFFMAQGDDRYVDKLMASLQPKEVLYQRGMEDRFESSFGGKHYTYRLDEWIFSSDLNYDKLCKQFGTQSLKGFGVESMTEGIAAAGAILYYLEFTEHREISHIASISRIDQHDSVWIDKFTIRNLELFSSSSGEAKTGFADVIDRTLTSMGGRMLKRWVAMPLLDVKRIEERQDVVEAIANDADLAAALREQVAAIGDLERLSSRIAAGRILPRELVQLKNSLTSVEMLKALLESTDKSCLHKIAESIDPLTVVRDRLARDIYPDPANNQIQKGGVIADGVSAELDDLRRIALHGKDVLQQIQQRESELTGIPSLKISYNNVFGYYIEVRNTHKDKVPETWIRKQTLTAAERYITEELKEYEEKILGAQERILQIEQDIYLQIIADISQHLRAILRDGAIVARIDCLQSFARMACECRYVRPTLDEGKVIDIRAGRHPVIERLMGVGEEYIPNDVLLNDSDQQIMMITGPNMSGKSALLRQTALIILMAQMGSFVPAEKAHIGVVDKIFTRVGASDNISQGESTFMVEMLESASILNNLSERSLILLDEIGRGTSTYDGISIAWAMVEYIHNYPTARAKTMFATHYHELNEMEQLFERIKNYHVSVREVDNTIVFLRKLARGGTEHSFGIHVARMAGMPASIVSRATDILSNLETVYGNNEIADPGAEKTEVPTAPSRRKKRQPSARQVADVAQQGSMQLQMFQLDDPVLIQVRDQIKGLDINSLTPLEALNKLNEIKKITGL
ncbi:MAG: DNA mismatch repair protein MutS [Rikenellaceae bacterium]|nr:DNA mismatch repair protein MutS [Rikenellaceae bacterium]